MRSPPRIGRKSDDSDRLAVFQYLLNCFVAVDFQSDSQRVGVLYRTVALTACNSCNDRTLMSPSVARDAIASTIACAPVIVVTQGTLYCKAARRIACSSKCEARPNGVLMTSAISLRLMWSTMFGRPSFTLKTF